jgi:hypothetical protein
MAGNLLVARVTWMEESIAGATPEEFESRRV